MVNSRPHGYALTGHGKMIADRIRTGAYVEAMQKVVKPDSIVLDLGAGTGFFSLVACKLGAAKVYAIEPDDTIAVAKELAMMNGFADRIVFIQNISTKTQLSEKVNIVVSDLRGVLPLFQNHIPSIVDIRNRYLMNNGVLLPKRDEIWASVVETKETYDALTTIWENSDDETRSYRRGIQLTPVSRMVTQTWFKVNLAHHQLLAECKQWHVLDYSCQVSPNVSGSPLTWHIHRAGTGHGVILWFDSYLTSEISFSNAPNGNSTIYGQAFFPWPEEVALKEDDRIEVTLDARLVLGEYVWRWETQIFRQSCDKQPIAHFNQTTFLGMPFSLSSLQKRKSDYIPIRTSEVKIDERILALMNGSNNLASIARVIHQEYPEIFATWEDAMTRVGELSDRYNC